MAYPNYSYPGYGYTSPTYGGRIEYTPQAPVQQGGNQGISPASRMVSNRDEANATPADFSGAPIVMPNPTNGRVYIKRWDMTTGTSCLEEYARVDDTSPTQYATMADLYEMWQEIERLKEGDR